MLIILPPSEAKAAGGSGGTLDLAGLAYPALLALRAELLEAVEELSQDNERAMAALKLGPKQLFEIERNRTLRTSPTAPALERYTGVLYDPIQAAALTGEQRQFASRHILVHSALFGLIGAGDLVPAYRLSHDSRVPGYPLKKHWATSIRAVLAERDGLILDLRSASYVGLGRAPVREESYYLRVVTADADGRKRALNHFNKKAKGELVRALVASGAVHADAAGLIDWARNAGITLSHSAPGELELLV